MRWSWFFCGVGFLLLAAYMDNVRGPLLPALALVMDFDFSAAGLVLVGGNITAMILTWFLMPLTNRYSLRRVSVITLGVLVLTCGAVAFVTSPFDLYVWGAVAGGVISIMGTLSNLYVQAATGPEARGRALSALHAVYGVGSFGAPLIAGQILRNPQDWRVLFYGVVLVAIAFCGWVVLRAPKSSGRHEFAAPQSIRLEPIQWLAIATFVAYVAGETLASMWMPAWFTAVRHTSLQQGSAFASVFFVCMTFTRFGCSFWINSRWARPVIWGCLIIANLCFVIGRLCDIPILIPLIGLVGPFFPLFLTHLTVRFPERDRSLVIWLLSLMQGTLAAMNFTIGHVADTFGMDIAYWMPTALMGTCMILLAVFFRLEKRIA